MESVITQVTKDSSNISSPSSGGDPSNNGLSNNASKQQIQQQASSSSSSLRRRFANNGNPPSPPSSPPPNPPTTTNDKDSGGGVLPPGEQNKAPSGNNNNNTNKQNFFRKLLNCWCCGRTRRSVHSERVTPPHVNSSSSSESNATEDEHQSNHHQSVLQNGGYGDQSHLPPHNNYNSADSNSLMQHSPPPGGYLLPVCHPDDSSKPCMVIDLDETLVHSSFKPIGNADFIVPVEIDGVVHQVYVAKRPYVDEFLQKMGQLYECILFTASLAKYADPVADLLDRWGVFRCRLFRDACVFHRGNYVKDLNKLGRSLQRVIIVDNSPASYIFHPDNAVPVASWFDDSSDTELLYLIPFFERLSSVDNVYTVLRNSNHPFNNTLKDVNVNKESDNDSRSDTSKQFDDNS